MSDESELCQTDDSHCLHDLRQGEEHAPGQVCCWCGDIFLERTDAANHGEYLPTTPVESNLKLMAFRSIEGPERQLSSTRQRLERVEGALRACADSLEEEVRGHHGVGADTKLEEMHPTSVRRFERDMAPVRDARDALNDTAKP